MEHWSVEHRAFAVETYFKNNDSVVLTEQIYRRHFNILRNDSVPSHSTLLLWVRNLEKQRLPQKENFQEDSLHLELLRTLNKCVRLLSEILGDQQAEMPLH
jgi:transposase-like protein